MLADLDETIRQLLIRDVPLDLAEVDVSFDAPDREWSGRLSRPTVNCYLYDVRENHEFRESDFPRAGPGVLVQRGEPKEGGSGGNRSLVRARPPIRIDVSYQVTVWARAAEDEHRLLWRVLSALLQHATLPEELLQGQLQAQPFPIRAQSAQPELGPKNAAELWQALDNRIRPGLTYMVTLALDTAMVFSSPLVFTRDARLRLRSGDPEEDDKVDAVALQIGGWVRDRRHPDQGLAGVRVRVRETGAEATTDEDGRFMFRRVRPGQATLVVEAPGRKQVTRRVEVPSAMYQVEI